MSDAPRIRQATADDVAELAAMRRDFTFEDRDRGQLREDFDDAFASIVAEGIASGQWVVWVAEAEGEIVSHAFVGLIEKIPRPTLGHRRLGYLTNVYTRPAHRDRGIGGALLDRVTTWARESDVELLVVWPSDESVPFYERAGFASRRDPLVWFP